MPPKKATSSKKSRTNKRSGRVTTEARRSRKRFGQILKTIIFILGTIGLIGLLIYLLFADSFQIKRVTITSHDEVLAAQVEEIVLPHIKKTTFFIPNTSQFLWTKSLVANLLDDYDTSIKSAEISIVDQELSIEVAPEIPSALWCQKGKLSDDCLGVSSEGVAFLANIKAATERATNDDSEALELLRLTDHVMTPAKAGDVIIKPIVLESLQLLPEELSDFGFQIDKVVLHQNFVELDLISDDGASVEVRSIHLPTRDQSKLDLAIKDLFLLLDTNELGSIAQREDIRYYELVDFTTRNKVFYKFVI